MGSGTLLVAGDIVLNEAIAFLWEDCIVAAVKEETTASAIAPSHKQVAFDYEGHL